MYRLKEAVVLFVSLGISFAGTETLAQQNCKDRKAGLNLDQMSRSSVALSGRHNATDDDSKHLGNAALILRDSQRLVFLTARHVVKDACAFLEQNPSADLVFEYRYQNLRGATYKNVTGGQRSEGFSLSPERCATVRDNYAKQPVDLDFISIPAATIPPDSFTLEHPLVVAPLLDGPEAQVRDSYYYGYKPFPDQDTGKTTLFPAQNIYVYRVNRAFDDGWSGTPVYATTEGVSGYFLSSIVISKPVLNTLYERYNNDEQPFSDRRAQAIAEEVNLAYSANARSLAARLSQFDFADWNSTQSRGVEMLELHLNGNDLTKDDKTYITRALDNLSSIEQFLLSAHLIKLINAKDTRLKSHPNLMYAIARSISEWCYCQTILADHFNNAIQPVYSQTTMANWQVQELIDWTSKIQKDLKIAYADKTAPRNQFTLKQAQGVFSLFYEDAGEMRIRPEIIRLGLSDDFLSNIVFEYGRVLATSGGESKQVIRAYEKAIALNDEHIQAKIALADHLNSNNINRKRAIELYRELMEQPNKLSDSAASQLTQSLKFAQTKESLGNL